MRAEEGDIAYGIGRQLRGQGFALYIEAVPGFGFQRGGAAEVRGVDAGVEKLAQAFGAGGAGGVHGDGDAPGGVVLPGHAGFELGGAVAVENHVGVGVHPSGQHRPPFEIDLGIAGGGVGGGANPGDDAVLGDERGAVKRAQVADGTEFADVGEKRGGAGHGVSPPWRRTAWARERRVPWPPRRRGRNRRRSGGSRPCPGRW